MRLKSAFFTLILSVGLLSSCSGDDGNEIDNSTACTDFTLEVKEYSDALAAFTQNPNPETCENYKTALRNFANQYKNCSLWTDSYQEALDNIENIDCSEMQN